MGILDRKRRTRARELVEAAQEYEGAPADTLNWGDPVDVAHLALAELFDRPEDGACLLRTTNQGQLWWLWDGNVYRSVTPELVGHDIQRWMEDKRHSEVGADMKKIDPAFVGKVLWVIQGWTDVQINLGAVEEPRIPLWLTDQVEDHPYYLSMANGILDLRDWLTGGPVRLWSPTPLWLSTSIVPYAYDPQATCPLWLSLLAQNLEGDAERIALLQEWFGYCLTSDIGEKKALFLYGDSNTGKSMVALVLEELVGRDNCSALAPEDMARRFQLATVVGKLVNISGEVGQVSERALDAFKKVTGGDPLLTEKKGVDPQKVHLSVRFTGTMNRLPQFRDRSRAAWDRVMILPFDREVPSAERNPALLEGWREDWPLRQELPGIFNWALDGLRRLKTQRGFTRPARTLQAENEWRTEADPVGHYLRMFYTRNPNGWVDKADVWRGFQQWCELNCIHWRSNDPMASTKFSSLVPKYIHGVRSQRAAAGANGRARPWYYVGMSPTGTLDELLAQANIPVPMLRPVPTARAEEAAGA